MTEGSTLGGVLICHHLTGSLKVVPGAGASFFHGNGPDTAARWRRFGSALEQAASEQNEQQIMDAAIETFETLGSWLGWKDPQGASLRPRSRSVGELTAEPHTAGVSGKG